MDKRVKLIWDFHGTDAEGTAKHHAIHLREYAAKVGLNTYGVGEEILVETEPLRQAHVIAYMIVDRDDMIEVRDALRPQRAEVAID